MDPLETLPWGREEAEQEKAFLSEAWLSTSMLEEDYDNNNTTAVGGYEEESDGASTSENGHAKDPEPCGLGESFIKWMEANDMELAMYQQNIIQQDLPKGCIEASDWEGSDSGMPDHTHALLQEFETLCEEYHGTLTPPHSRTPSPPLYTTTQYIPVYEQPPIKSEITPVEYTLDVAQELALLDELVRVRAEALENATPTVAPKCTLTIPEQTSPIEMLIPDAPTISVPIQTPASLVDVSAVLEVIVPEMVPNVKVEVPSAALSPGSLQEVPTSSVASPSSSYYLSPNSVAPSSPESPRPNTPNSSSCGEASDPEWVPVKVVPKRQRAKPYSRSSRLVSSGYSSSERSEFSPAPSTSRGRRAPRVKGQRVPDDRKERKKEQNKNAATRYRQKKKAEAEEVASEEKELEDKNDVLRAKATDLAREVSYLKKLLKDMFKARGMME